MLPTRKRQPEPTSTELLEAFSDALCAVLLYHKHQRAAPPAELRRDLAVKTQAILDRMVD